jgi:uncharacterized protein YjaG (DUF416 family)
MGGSRAIDGCYRICEKAKTVEPIKTEIETWLSKVAAITPDTEDFGNKNGSDALNACVGVLHTLLFLLQKEASDIFHIGNAFYETIDVTIQEDQHLTEEQIEKHPLIQETKNFLLEQTK